MKLRPLLIACAVCAMPAANGQSIDERIAAAQSPDVMLQFATRAGVCGNGRNIRFDDSSRNRWFEPCEYGPARVRLRLDDGQVRSIRTFVGGSRTAGANVTDLGEVPAIEAAQWFLELARTAPATIAEDAIMPAAIADAPDPWRDLLAIARNGRIDSEVRENAVFWVGQSAAREATRELAAIVDSDTQNIEVRKAAVFALSQRDEPERTDYLLRIARTDRNAEVVAVAYFWLADAPDERALALFEEVLSVTID